MSFPPLPDECKYISNVPDDFRPEITVDKYIPFNLDVKDWSSRTTIHPKADNTNISQSKTKSLEDLLFTDPEAEEKREAKRILDQNKPKVFAVIGSKSVDDVKAIQNKLNEWLTSSIKEDENNVKLITDGAESCLNKVVSKYTLLDKDKNNRVIYEAVAYNWKKNKRDAIKISKQKVLDDATHILILTSKKDDKKESQELINKVASTGKNISMMSM